MHHAHQVNLPVMTAPVYRCVYSATAYLTVPTDLTNTDVVRFIVNRRRQDAQGT